MEVVSTKCSAINWLPVSEGTRRWVARLALVVLAVSAPVGSATLGLVVLLLSVPFLYSEAKLAGGMRSSRAFGILTGPVVALIAAGLLSTVFSTDKLHALGHVVGMALMALTCLLSARIAVRERHFFLNIAIPLALVATVISAALGLYQHFALGVSRATALLGYTNRLGTLLAFFGVLGAGFLLYRGGRVGWLLFPFGLLVLGGIGATMSRAGWVAVAVGIILLGLRADRRFIAACLVLAMLFAVGLLLEERWASRFSTIFSLEENQDRITLWKAALGIFRDHPLLGSGPGSFLYVSDNYIDAPRHRSHATPHNIVLSIASDMGALGLLAFGWLMTGVAKAAWYLWRLRHPFYTGLVAAVASIFVNDLFAQGFYTTQIGTVMWFGLGLLAAFYEMEKDLAVAPTVDAS